MKIECIECLVDCNREIEFSYKNKRYSVTYNGKGQERAIYFCEFYKDPAEVKTASELLKLKIGAKTLDTIFSELPDSAFYIF